MYILALSVVKDIHLAFHVPVSYLPSDWLPFVHRRLVRCGPEMTILGKLLLLTSSKTTGEKKDLKKSVTKSKQKSTKSHLKQMFQDLNHSIF